MKPNQTVPLLATLAPAAVAAPPLLILAAIGVGLIWLFSEKQEPAPPPPEREQPAPTPSARADSNEPNPPSRPPKAASKRITREDLAEALEYGARTLTRQEAVATLQALGFRKTAAYKALLPNGRFAQFIELTADGLVEWNG